MNKFLTLLLRILSLAASAAVVVVLTVYPRLAGATGADVSHGFLVVLLFGVSFACVYGFGFIPKNRILKVLFTPLFAWPLMAVGSWGLFLR